jgi:TonB family protein
MGIKLILTVIIVVGLSGPANLNAEPLPSEQQQSSARKEYGHLLVENLEKLKRYPTVLIGMHAEGTVLVFFTVNREGKITESKISKGSGNPLLDEEALSMFTRAQQMPPFPAGIEENSLSFTIPIVFKSKNPSLSPSVPTTDDPKLDRKKLNVCRGC